MSAKAWMPNQHTPLHLIYGITDCCLCKSNLEKFNSEIRVNELENAIRKHRDQKGDDRCWQDDEELYTLLPEGYTIPERDSTVELELCKKFINSRRNPKTEYISPQRKIEELEREIERLKNEKGL